jgi:hypothetical protein
MSKLSILDWSLVVGVIVYGVCLALYFEKKYRFAWYNFLLVSFFIAALAAVLIGTYQVLRTAFLLP